jgi:hypothetical protein
MNLETALEQINGIHGQMHRTRLFRGYRSITTLSTGCLAALAAIIQGAWMAESDFSINRYIDLWVGVAVLSVLIVGVEITLRFRRCESPLQRELTAQAIEQFLPCVVVGALVTAVLALAAPSGLRFLPGLWQIFFGLGMLASRRLLPPPIALVGMYYLICGVVCLSLPWELAFSPWTMGGVFTVGQLCSAAILYWKLERNHE